MKPKRKVERAIRQKLHFTVGSAFRDRLLTDVMNAREESMQIRLVPCGPGIGRRIMKTRIAKVASVAAVIAVAALAMTFWSRFSSPAYAITDLPGQFEQAHTIHVKGWHYFPEHTMPDGSAVPPSPIDNWTDVVNARSRFTTTQLTSGADGVKVYVSEVVRDGPSWLRIDHGDRKSVTYFRVSKYQQKLGVRQISKLISGQLFGDITQLSNSIVVGTERINGVACDIWQSDDAHGGRWRQWLSADTGRLVRAQALRKVDSGEWKVATDYSLIEYNVEPPEGTFSLEPPEGYTASNSPQTAYSTDLGKNGVPGFRDEDWYYYCGPKLAFALPDGSIVLGWQSFDPMDAEKQAVLFEGMTFGGPLPKLPVEFYALIPDNGSSEPLYTGYHLAFTRKQGRFAEWGLYVPNGTPPADVQMTGYEMLCRWNLELARHFTIDHMTVKPEFTIETPEEFDEWVLGAMAELADNGTAPENLTYQKVIDLAQRVRASVAP
jgi:outer membrane lipoprotein-sorting protein